MTRDELFGYLAHDNVSAFLSMLRWCEGTGGDGTKPYPDDEAYRALFGWRPGNGKVFESIDDHPRVRTYERDDEFIANGKKDFTTAAGAYQITASTWDWIAPQIGANDFGSTNQDLAAVALIRSRGALDLVTEGRIDEAIDRCKNVWASLPGSQWGQPTKKLEAALAVYRAHGGRIAGEAAPAAQPVRPAGPVVAPAAPSIPRKEVSMAPIVIPILQSLAAVLPALGKWFGSGSEVANRNVAAGTMIAEELVKVTQAVNLQEAAERIQANPSLVQAANDAVSSVLTQLGEAGGGGIDGARKAALAPDGDWRKLVFSLPFVGILIFAPLVWAVVASAVFKAPWLVEMEEQLRGTVVGFVLGTIAGAIVAFIYGSSASSRNKDAALVARQP